MNIQNVSKKFVLLFSVSILFIFSLSGCFQGLEEEVDKGTIVILNGTSSAGKSSIGKNLKEEYGFECLHLDTYLANSFAKWVENRILEETGENVFLERNNPNLILENFKKTITKMNLNEDDYDDDKVLTKEEEIAHINKASAEMFEEAKRKACDGNNVIVDTIIDFDTEEAYSAIKENLSGFNIKFVLAYCPFKVLAQRVEKRNIEGGAEERALVQPLVQFGEVYKAKENDSEIIVDVLTKEDFKQTCKLAKIDFRINDKEVFNEETNFYIEKYNKFLEKLKRELGFDNEEIESVKITPRLSYDLIINTNENSPEESAKQIKELIDVIKQWEEIVRDGSVITFKVYNKVLDSELIEKLRKIWVEATFSSYIAQELEKNKQLDESRRLSEEEVKKKVREFCIDNWPEGEGELDYPRGRGVCEAGAYRIIAFKNDEPIGFVFFVNDIVNEDGVVQNILKPNEKWIEPLMVHLSAHGLGLGKILAFSILKLLPDTKRIVLVTGKDNLGACSFYRHIGFKPYIQDSYEYDQEESQFFEWINPNID